MNLSLIQETRPCSSAQAERFRDDQALEFTPGATPLRAQYHRGLATASRGAAGVGIALDYMLLIWHDLLALSRGCQAALTPPRGVGLMPALI